MPIQYVGAQFIASITLEPGVMNHAPTKHRAKVGAGSRPPFRCPSFGRAQRPSPTLTLFALLGALLLAAQAAWAQPTSFGQRESQVKVCNLVVTSAGPDDNPEPHVWYISDQSPWLPFGWELMNAGAPGELTQSARARWDKKYGGSGDGAALSANTGLILGSWLGKLDAPYWEIVHNIGELERLKDYDLIFLHNHSPIAFTPPEVAMLEQLADAGVTIWIDDSGGMTVSSSSSHPLFQIHGQPAFGGGLFASATTDPATSFPMNPLHRLLNWPYDLDLFDVRNLSKGATPWDRVVLETETEVGGFEPLVADAGGEALLAAGRYGSGHVVVSSLGIGTKLNNSAGPSPQPIASNAYGGIVSGTDFSKYYRDPARRWDGDFKFAFNLLDWRGEWPAFGATPRRIQRGQDFPGAVLDEQWTLQTTLPATPSAGAGFLIPSPVVSNGIAVAASPDGWLYVIDLNPKRDLDGDGNPDDGLQETVAGANYDIIWKTNLGEPIYATPTITHVNWTDSTGSHSDDIVIVATGAGRASAWHLLPRNPDGTLAFPTSPGWPGPAWVYQPGTAAYYASPVVSRGVVYLVDSAGRIDALDLSQAMAAGPTGTVVPFASKDLATSVVATPASALVKDELTGATDETLYCATQSGQLHALVFYTSEERLVPEDVAAGIWRSQRAAFTADNADPAYPLKITLNGVLKTQGVDYSVLGTSPLTINFTVPPPTTSDVRASYKVLGSEKWSPRPSLPSPLYSSPAVSPDGIIYLAPGGQPFAVKDHGYYSASSSTGRAPEQVFSLKPDPAAVADWSAFASPAFSNNTLVFALNHQVGTRTDGFVLGLEANPDLTIHLSHSRIAVDSALSIRDFNASPTGPAPQMNPYDATNAPNGYRLDAESGAISFAQRDAAKRIVVTYHYIDPATSQVAAGPPVTEYYTLPRLIKWQFPSVGVNLGGSVAAGARVLVVRAGVGPYPDPNDAVVQPLWIDRGNLTTGRPAFIHLPLLWQGFSFNVFVNDAPAPVNPTPLVCNYSQNFTLGPITASPAISGNAVYLDALRISSQPTERDLFCLQLDPADGTELDLETNSAWGTNFRRFTYNDDLEIDPDNLGNGNGAYDLLGVSRSVPVPNFVGSPALSEGKALLASASTSDGTNWFWSLSARNPNLGPVADGQRILSLRRDGTAEAELHSTMTNTALGSAVRTDKKAFSNPGSVQSLARFGRPGHLLVADTGNLRVVEVDEVGRAIWSLENPPGAGAFFDDLFGSHLLAAGQPWTISRPKSALRSEIPERDAGGNLTGRRCEATFLADSGNFRALALDNRFNPAAHSYARPAPTLIWRTDDTQKVFQSVDRGTSGQVALDTTSNLPTFHGQKVAGTYQYLSCQPVTLGQSDNLGVRWNSAAGLPEFDYAVLGVDNYAMDRFPDSRFQTLESGPGASIVIAQGQHYTWDAVNSKWVTDPNAGQILAAFSGFYSDPAAVNQTDPGDSTLTAIRWGRPYDRVFTQINSVEVSGVREGYPASGWVTLYLTVAGTVARNPWDVSAAAPEPPYGPGVYPITFMMYIGTPPADPGDYNAAANALRFHGRPYLSLPPQVAGLTPGTPFGRPIRFDQAKYRAYMASFATVGSPKYPIQYTGSAAGGYYDYFLPSSASLCSNGHTYVIVNSHDQKSEVFEWDPRLEAASAAADLTMKNISPRPAAWSQGNPAFFGGASGLKQPASIGRDF